MSVAAASQSTAVYRYYDEYGVLIYVGITGRGHRRFAEHVATKEWWPFVASQEVEHLPTRGDALERERQLIAAHHPPFNTQHNPDQAGRHRYEAMRALIADDEGLSPSEWFARLGRSWDLAIVNQQPASLTLAIAPRYWHAAKALGMPIATVLVRADGSKVGSLASVQIHGGSVELVARLKRPLRPIASARLRVALPHDHLKSRVVHPVVIDLSIPAAWREAV